MQKTWCDIFHTEPQTYQWMSEHTDKPIPICMTAMLLQQSNEELRILGKKQQTGTNTRVWIDRRTDDSLKNLEGWTDGWSHILTFVHAKQINTLTWRILAEYYILI